MRSRLSVTTPMTATIWRGCWSIVPLRLCAPLVAWYAVAMHDATLAMMCQQRRIDEPHDGERGWAMAENEGIRLEREGQLATITLDRPRYRNAVNLPMLG